MRDIIVCDDEKVWRSFLVKDIGRWAAETNRELSFTEFSKGSELIEHVKNARPVDAVFLDIEFGDEMNGIDVARELRKMGSTVPIVFVSGHPIRACEGYKVDAADFLVKRHRYNQLVYCLKKIVKITTPVESRVIMVEDLKKITHRLLADEIVYAETLGREVILHIRNKGTVRTNLTLNSLLEELKSDTFLQVHKSFVVSTKHIAKFKMTRPYLLYIHENSNQEPKDIPVGRNFYQNVQLAYAQTVMDGAV